MQAWLSNDIHIKEWDVITHAYPNANGGEVRAFIGDYSTYKTMDMISYPCPSLG